MAFRVLHRSRSLLFTLACVALAGLATPAKAAAEPPATKPAATPPATPAAAPFAMPDTLAGKVMTRVLASLAKSAPAGVEPLAASDFSESFLKQVPFEQVQSILTTLRGQEGGLTPQKVDQEKGQDKLVIRAVGATSGTPLLVIVGLDADKKIETLLLRPALAEAPALKDWNDLDARLRDLPGVTNFAAYQVRLREGADTKDVPPAVKLAEVHTFHADQRLAIGSSFKLYVLGALAEAVQAGTARWDDKLPIKDMYKSLPSGKLQDEVEGREFPLSHYADLMISISDNTAADHLIHRLSRGSVEAYAATVQGPPVVNRPFLTTRELFALRLKPDPTLVERWLIVDENVRRDMLLPADPVKLTRPMGVSHNPGEVAAWQLDPGAISRWKTPRNIDKIEWFASAEECCRVMADLARREKLPNMAPLGHALRINPGAGVPIDTARWPKIGFKGGSEPGVMNLTWLLTRDDGKLFVLTIGWNDTAAALDESKLVALGARAIEQLAKEQ